MPATHSTPHPASKSTPLLPKEIYHSPAIFSRMQEHMFARSWQCVGMNSHFDEAGIVQPFLLMEDLLNEPLLMICDEKEKLHCLSNVCPQSGRILLHERSQLTELRCPQGKRRYNLQGQRIDIPQAQATDHLLSLELHDFGDLLFTGLNPSQPFEGWIEPLAKRTDKMPWSHLAHAGEYSSSTLIHANWTLYVDQILDQQGEGVRQELYPAGVLLLHEAGTDAPSFDFPAGHPDYGQKLSGLHYWLWPNLLLNVYPWGLVLGIIDPISPTETRIRRESFLWEAHLLDPLFADLLQHAELERAAQLESQQKGVQSRLFRGKQPEKGSAVEHFHKMLASALDS